MNSSRSQYSDREYANHDVELLSDEPGLGVARGHTIIRKGGDRHISMSCLEMMPQEFHNELPIVGQGRAWPVDIKPQIQNAIPIRQQLIQIQSLYDTLSKLHVT